MRSYFLLTGASGLLGSYLAKDALQAGLRLAVVVRRSRLESASARIESMLARWERQLHRVLPRPVVLEGDICQPGLGLPASDLQWVRRHCHSIVHSAASLSFEVDEKTNEPWRSNLEGTRQVVDLARSAGIRQFHHVSTAYVCGLRSDRVLETDVDQGQTFGNVYEASKLQAEQLVRTADCFDQVTVHRPAIIVGDSKTGYTTTYHGFYTPLKVVHLMVGKVPLAEIHIGQLLAALGLTGQERKNFVPVDWVSSVMTHILARPELHGRTYHLAPQTRVPIAEMTAVFEQAIQTLSLQALNKPSATPLDGSAFEEVFRTQMQTYQSYWRDDPEFDCAHTLRAAPHLPCPRIDAAMMWRLSKYAIENNFGWPLPSPIPALFTVAQHLENALEATRGVLPLASRQSLSGDQLALQVVGPGGGQWTLELAGEELVGIDPGVSDDALPRMYLTSDTFRRLATTPTSAAEALRAGSLVLWPGTTRPERWLAAMDQVIARGTSAVTPQAAGLRG